MKLDEMRLLVRVAETGSMTKAAKQSHITPAAVSAAVQRAEKQLGVRLFERTTRSLSLTDEGATTVAGCREVLDLWRRTVDEVQGDGEQLRGTVKVSAPSDTMFEVLEPLVAELCSAHPGLRVEVNTTDAVQQLHREDIDLAIRYGELSDSGLVSQALARGPAVLVASPQYVQDWGVPSLPEDLSEHSCVTLELSGIPVSEWVLTGNGETVRVPISSQVCGNGLLARRWALRGLGIARKSLIDVVHDLESGRLVRVLPAYSAGDVAVHVLLPSRRFVPSRVRAVRAAILRAFEARAERSDEWLLRTSGGTFS